VEGAWSWELPIRSARHRYAAILEQRFQRAEGFARVRNRRALLRQVQVQGEQIAIGCDITLDGIGYARHQFAGRVQGDAIAGEVRIDMPSSANKSIDESIVLPWRAERVPASDYFAPTGLDAP
jgi:hypothetical protein